MINFNVAKPRAITWWLSVLLLFISSFTAFAQAPANDDKANAVLFTFDGNGEFETSPAQYTTVDATADGPTPANWASHNRNVWFEFEANSTEVSVLLETGVDPGTGVTMGTIQRPLLVLYRKSDNLELASSIYNGNQVNIGLSSDQLVSGEDYYISVDNSPDHLSYAGSFTLIVANEASHDIKERAVAVSFDASGKFETGPAQYTTAIGTPDGPTPAKWSSHNRNVWFEFEANSTEVSVLLETGVDPGTGVTMGTIQRPLLTLYRKSDNLELASSIYNGNQVNIGLSSDQLTSGEDYYISVDNATDHFAYTGSFTLTAKNEASHDFRDHAVALSFDASGKFETGPAQYTTAIGTPDGPTPTKWASHNRNVWFEFEANSTEVSVLLETGVDPGTGVTMGTIQRPLLILYRKSNDQELASSIYNGNQVNIGLSSDQLVSGEDYYISVDNATDHFAYTGSFTLTAKNEASHDFRDHAVALSFDASGKFETGPAQYTTAIGTPDGPTPTKWASHNRNVWFEFEANSTEVSVLLETGVDPGTGVTMGTIQRPLLILYRKSDNLEVASSIYNGNQVNIGLSSDQLVSGEDYYISVDNATDHYAYTGSFTLTVTNETSHDFKDRAVAISLDANGDYCSGNAEYTTAIATPDGPDIPGWSSHPNQNVWFYFDVSTTGVADIDVNVGGTEGTMIRPMLTLFDHELNLIGKQAYSANGADISIENLYLTPGRYFISVDNDNSHSSYAGSFTLCVDYDSTIPLPDNQNDALNINSLLDDCTSGQTFTNIGATNDPPTGYAALNNNVWFTFLAPTSGEVTFQMTNQSVGEATLVLLDKNMNIFSSFKNEYGYTMPELSAAGLQVGERYFLTIGSPGNLAESDFDLCVTDEATFDYLSGALDINHLLDDCSLDAAYDNFPASTSVSTLFNHDVWYHFNAPNNGVATIRALTGNGKGTLSDGTMKLVKDNSGNGEVVQVVRAVNGLMEISRIDLTPTAKYYIAVGTVSPNAVLKGSFTLCLDLESTYDHQDGAVELGAVTSYCSANEEYSTEWSTTDNFGVSSFENNVWFSFIAPDSQEMDITVNRGTGTGTLSDGRIILFDGTNPFNSIDIGSNEETTINATGLTAGGTYYVSVGSRSPNSFLRGTFTLCLNNPNPPLAAELWAIASGAWDDPNTWSTSDGGVSTGAIPTEGTIVTIKGFHVIYQNSGVVAKIIIDGNAGSTSRLEVQSGVLNVIETIIVSGPEARFDTATGSIVKVIGDG